MKIETAAWEDHAEISQLAKKSKYTKGFVSGGLRFVDTYYARNFVLKATHRGKIVGFVCVYHCSRKKHSSIYYISTDGTLPGTGRALLKAALKQSPHTTLRLIVEAENEKAIGFYKHLGFTIESTGANKHGEFLRMMYEGEL